MIKFRTVFDENSVKQLSKHTLKKQLWIYIVLSVALLLIGVFNYSVGEKEIGLFLIIFGLIFVPILLLTVKFSQRKVNETMSILSGETVEIYEFNEEGISIQTNKGEEYFSLITAKYGYLYKVEETETNYFLYISKLQSHIVDKRFLIEGSIEQLNELFQRKLGERFKAKKK